MDDHPGWQLRAVKASCRSLELATFGNFLLRSDEYRACPIFCWILAAVMSFALMYRQDFWGNACIQGNVYSYIHVKRWSHLQSGSLGEIAVRTCDESSNRKGKRAASYHILKHRGKKFRQEAWWQRNSEINQLLDALSLMRHFFTSIT